MLGRLKALKRRYDPWVKIRSDYDGLKEIFQLAVEEKDESLEPDVRSTLEGLEKRYGEQKVLEQLGGENDASSAFVTIHSGAGGTEACDWVSMLYRMYTRWSDRHSYTIDILDILEAEGGIKSVTMQVNGAYAYGYLKAENRHPQARPHLPVQFQCAAAYLLRFGVLLPRAGRQHRRRHRPEDLRVDTYRAGGAGGQHVNKTDSAVRLTHLPTGIVVQCQNERSQYKNKAFAMKVLRSRLYEYYKNERDKDREKMEQEKKDISWGNQIRSYTFQPYTLVKDHRTKFEVGNIQAVMDGEIDGFIEEYLKMQWLGKTSKSGSSDGSQRTDS